MNQSRNFLVFCLIAPIGSNKDIFFKYMQKEKNQQKFKFEIVKEIKISEHYLTPIYNKAALISTVSTLETELSESKTSLVSKMMIFMIIMLLVI